ncbi:MAG: hypothetical protein HYS86_04045 [Candidatus Chisholmbacteria bacterium]|nr:hypothetical protein [Candidatus Chisholmbacteria bacterium]
MMDPTLKKTLNIGSLVLAAFFVTPTVVILASWNALPGDILYSTKRNLEGLALRLTAGSYGTNTNLQTQILARRADEAIVLALERSSTDGLDDLKNQVQVLRAQVAAAPTTQEKQAVAQKAVAKLQQSKTKLRQTQVTLAQAPSSTTIIRETTVTQQIVHYIPIIIQPPPPPPSTTDDIIDQISDTEDEITGVIDDLTEIVPTSLSNPSPTPEPSSPGRSRNPFGNFGDNRGNNQSSPQPSPTTQTTPASNPSPSSSSADN